MEEKRPEPKFAPNDGSQPIYKNARWEKYSLGRVNGLSVREAYRNAGYEGESWASASKIENKPLVKQRVQWLREQAAERVVTSNAVSRSELIESIRDTRKLAKEGTPVVDKHGVEVGIRRDLSAANRADEILAKMHGFMLDVTRNETLDEELEGKSPDDLKVFVLSLLEQLDPNLKKQIVAEVEVDDEDVSEDRVLQ